MKKPSPWMATSVARPVDCEAPWLNRVVMAPTFTPRPTWAGLVPPAPPPAGELAPLSIWLRRSWKITWLDLNPTVLTLAMLLPMVSIIVWWLRRPVTPENIERSIYESLLGEVQRLK